MFGDVQTWYARPVLFYFFIEVLHQIHNEIWHGEPQALICLKINMNPPKVTQAGSIRSVLVEMSL